MNTINFTATINPTIDIARLDSICANIKANVQAFADFESDAFFMGDTLPVRPVFLDSWEKKLSQLEQTQFLWMHKRKEKPMGLTKKEICERSETIAYYSGLCGVEVKQITYGIEEFIYCVSGAWGGGKSYHKLKIQTDSKGNMFVRLHGYKLPLDEFIRTGKEQTKLWEL